MVSFLFIKMWPMIFIMPLTNSTTQWTAALIPDTLTFLPLLLYSSLDKVMRGNMPQPLEKKLLRKSKQTMDF
jgi:hypothetical protein